jgi:cytoskeletal protein CcmA (bactofilin family)
MFNRDSKRARIETLIGKESRLHGDLEFVGGLHLDGRITGNVTAAPGTSSSLSVSESASIEGAVEVPNIMLNGTVRGDIFARERLVLGANARVEGNVSYGVIEMTLGAEIMGTLTQVTAEPPGEASAGPAAVASG